MTSESDLDRWARVTFEPEIGALPTMRLSNGHGPFIDYDRVKRLASEKLGASDPRVAELARRLSAGAIGAWMN